MSGLGSRDSGINSAPAGERAKRYPANNPPIKTSQSRAANATRRDSSRRDPVGGKDRQHVANAPPKQAALAAPSPRLRKDSQGQKQQPGISVRYVAVQQLLRIEEEGAYAGLVNGAPTLNNARQKQSKVRDDSHDDDVSDLDGDSRCASEQRNSAALSPQQQRTLRQLVSGVTRWRRQLDYVISHVTSRSVTQLDSDIRQVLRLAVFELTHMSLARHAVSDYVDLARQVAGHQGAANLTNGVLRDVVRRMEAGDMPDPKAELSAGGGAQDAQKAVRCLAIAHSHPSWLAKRWIKRFGALDAEELMAHNNRPPLYTVRANPLRGLDAKSLCDQLKRDGIDARPSPWLPSDFLEIHSGLQQLLALGYVARGDCLVQDVSAGLVVAAALAPKPGERVLDCCAAPGGKTMFAAARMQGKGTITAVDISAARLGAVRSAAAAAAVPAHMVRCVAGDLVHLAPEQLLPPSFSVDNSQPSVIEDSSSSSSRPSAASSRSQTSRTASSSSPASASQGVLYDRVLVDAPCSGSGVLAKRADLRWRRQAEDMPQLLSAQSQLLGAAAALVRPGGALVYSTCSIEEDENMRQVEQFLQQHTDFELHPITAEELQQQGIPPDILTKEGCIATLPHVHRGADGAFAARLRRRPVAA